MLVINGHYRILEKPVKGIYTGDRQVEWLMYK